MQASQSEKEERLALDLSRRKHFRVDCDLKVTFRLIDDDSRHEGVLRNIGLGGARLDCDLDLPMPCRLELELPGGADEAKIVLPCSVAWTVADRGEGPFPTGLQIAPIDEATRKRLFSRVATFMR